VQKGAPYERSEFINTGRTGMGTDNAAMIRDAKAADIKNKILGALGVGLSVAGVAAGGPLLGILGGVSKLISGKARGTVEPSLAEPPNPNATKGY
jgi:hypothetical protein